MILYFLRHGLAMDRTEWQGDDHFRPLTGRGMKNMQRQAETLRALDIRPQAILTSPLVRAYQTADIVAKRLNLADNLVQDERLGPGFGYPELAEIVLERQKAAELMLVGHEPGFSQTIGRLIGGGNVVCKKGGLARIDLETLDPPQGTLVWLAPPKILIG